MAERRIPRGTDNTGLLLGDLLEGTRVGELVIVERLGARGTGHLYKAQHRVLPRTATVHVLPAAEGELRPVALDLLREACVIDAVDHPGMPRVFDCGLLPDRRPWIASEWIEGRTVAHVLEASQLAIGEILAIIRDVAEILVEAHRRGLVHGHVSPAAIVLPAHLRRFPLCLVDWVGVRTHDSTAPLPLVVGSRYTSPEQAGGIALEPRSDVYALGRIGKDLLARTTDDEVSPLLLALLDSMTATHRDARPTSLEVRNTAAWLIAELAADDGAAAEAPESSGIPDPASEATVRSAPITSEFAAAVAGEITPRG